MKKIYLIALMIIISYQCHALPEMKIKINNMEKESFPYTISGPRGVGIMATGNIVPGNNNITIPETEFYPVINIEYETDIIMRNIMSPTEWILKYIKNLVLSEKK